MGSDRKCKNIKEVQSLSERGCKSSEEPTGAKYVGNGVLVIDTRLSFLPNSNTLVQLQLVGWSQLLLLGRRAVPLLRRRSSNHSSHSLKQSQW